MSKKNSIVLKRKDCFSKSEQLSEIYSVFTKKILKLKARKFLVEFKNLNGVEGWLYWGDTIIAFDMQEEGGFSIVDRDELAFFCEKHVSDEVVTDKRYAYLKKYTRNGRQDVITMLKLHDIKSLMSYRVWEYDQRYWLSLSVYENQ